MSKFIGKRRVVAIIIVASLITGVVVIAYSGHMFAIGPKDQPSYDNINTTSKYSSSTMSRVNVIVSNNNSLFSDQNDTEEWLTYHHDFFRTGFDSYMSNISSPSSALPIIHRNWTSITLDGAVYAEPLVAQGRVYVATENNTIYSLDVETGEVIWHANLGAPVPRADLPCGDLDPTGITGTPVIDMRSRTIFAVAFLRDSHQHDLFALDFDTGKIRFETLADPQGADPLTEQQRGALALLHYNAISNHAANDTVKRGQGGIIVYIPFGGLFGDCGPYHGWMVGAPIAYASLMSNSIKDKTTDEDDDDNNNATSLYTSETDNNHEKKQQQEQLPLLSFQIPTSREGGIWAPSGPAMDSKGNIFVTKGNSESSSQFDFGNSVIRLSPELAKIVDWFAPGNWAELDNSDTDLGSVGPAILSNDLNHYSGNNNLSASVIFQIGKQGIGYILRTDRLRAINGQIYSAPVCDRGAFGGIAYIAPYLYVPCRDGLAAIYLQPTVIDSNSTGGGGSVNYSGSASTVTTESKFSKSNNGSSSYRAFSVKWKGPSFWAGPPIVAYGAVWTIDLDNGTLYAFDMTTGKILFQENLGDVTHFSTPSSAHGQIFVPVYNKIVCFSTNR